MNTSSFVSGSSILLAGWLGATFFNEVPAQRYPKLDKATASVETGKSPSIAPAVNAVILPSSASR
jgi:hypothetical protein